MTLPNDLCGEAVRTALVSGALARARSVSAEPCPDDNLVAGFAEGRLLPIERAFVLEHAAHCPACQALIVQVAGDTAADATREVRPPRRTTWLAVAAAAAVVLAVLGALWIGRAPEDPDRLLMTAAAGLAREDPELFAGLTALDHDLRIGIEPERTRGMGLTLLAPRENVLDRRPTLRWEGSLEGETIRLEILDVTTMQVVWTGTVTTTSAAWPEDAPALVENHTYLWEAEATEAIHETKRRLAFHLASPELRERWARIVRRVDETTDRSVAGILRAHFAVQLGLYGEAERSARDHLHAYPDDPLGRETLYYVLQRLGADEAGRYADHETSEADKGAR